MHQILTSDLLQCMIKTFGKVLLLKVDICIELLNWNQLYSSGKNQRLFCKTSSDFIQMILLRMLNACMQVA